MYVAAGALLCYMQQLNLSKQYPALLNRTLWLGTFKRHFTNQTKESVKLIKRFEIILRTILRIELFLKISASGCSFLIGMKEQNAKRSLLTLTDYDDATLLKCVAPHFKEDMLQKGFQLALKMASYVSNGNQHFVLACLATLQLFSFDQRNINIIIFLLKLLILSYKWFNHIE